MLDLRVALTRKSGSGVHGNDCSQGYKWSESLSTYTPPEKVINDSGFRFSLFKSPLIKPRSAWLMCRLYYGRPALHPMGHNHKRHNYVLNCSRQFNLRACLTSVICEESRNRHILTVTTREPFIVFYEGLVSWGTLLWLLSLCAKESNSPSKAKPMPKNSTQFEEYDS